MAQAAERGRRRCLTARCAAGTRGGMGRMRKLKKRCAHDIVL